MAPWSAVVSEKPTRARGPVGQALLVGAREVSVAREDVRADHGAIAGGEDGQAALEDLAVEGARGRDDGDLGTSGDSGNGRERHEGLVLQPGPESLNALEPGARARSPRTCRNRRVGSTAWQPK
jgi:hypothetical protein